MTIDEIERLRQLLYPLGLLPLIAFSARFLVQWWLSEKEGKTVVPKIFWHFSLLGNILLALHAYIQLHFPLYFLQATQAALSWRNLNLLEERAKSFRRSITVILGVALFSMLLFLSQYWLLPAGSFSWIRPPRPQVPEISLWLHAMGSLGMAAFSLRFWVQWWEAERAKESVLLAPFWWISLVGTLLSGIYFTLLHDWVNVIGPLCAVIPYTRNLILSKRKTFAPCDIALIAGETSGDLIGKQIAKQFLLKNPSIRLAGIAGSAMRNAGVAPWLKTESFQVMGLFDVLKKAFFLYRSIQSLTKNIIRVNPRAVLFIDQPSFGLACAKRLRRKGFTGKLIQVVAPTVWAYKKERAALFAAYFDHIMPLYRFECAYFKEKMPTTWVGHPFVEIMRSLPQEKSKKYLALFPGSRESEIRKNLPLELEAASLLLQKNSSLIPAVVLPDMVPQHIRRWAEQKLHAAFLQGEIISFENRYRLMHEAKAAITKSGTVTLELALLQVPFVCCFKTGFFTRFWLKNVCKLESSLFALPNIFMKKQVFPERILPPVSAKDIAKDLEPYVLGTSSFPLDVTTTILENIDTKDCFGKRVVDAVESGS